MIKLSHRHIIKSAAKGIITKTKLEPDPQLIDNALANAHEEDRGGVADTITAYLGLIDIYNSMSNISEAKQKQIDLIRKERDRLDKELQKVKSEEEKEGESQTALEWLNRVKQSIRSKRKDLIAKSKDLLKRDEEISHLLERIDRYHRVLQLVGLGERLPRSHHMSESTRVPKGWLDEES